MNAYSITRRTMVRRGELAVSLFILLCVPSLSWAVYDVPSDRRTTWNAGLDAEGGIPNYAQKKNAVVDYGADNTDVADATAAIQNCVNGVLKPGACYLPPGTYRVAGTIRMPAQVVLRGAGPAATILDMRAMATITFDGGDKTGMGSVININSGYTKDSTTLTLASTSGLAVNDWISIFQNNDPTLVDTKGCGWCGDDNNNGAHVMQQFAKITAIGGTTITINRPIYFTFAAANQPQVRKVPFGVFMAGLENLKLDRTERPNDNLITGEFSRHCWLKNIESHNGGDNNNEQHLQLRFSHGWEIRDSYLHNGYGHGSGQNYGIHILFWNSDHKIENNIFVDLRHGVNFEGGGSGVAVLYNYFDSHFESEDSTYLSADLNPNHGSHPFMVLLEGNNSAKLVWDYTWGSSSHNTAFRNYVRVQRSAPSVSWGRWGIDVQSRNRYMNLIGNVVGLPTWTSGTVTANGSCSPTEPIAFRFGCSGEPGSYTDSQARSTAIMHGNFDYITRGVATWDGGADHVLQSSMYYSSKPAFFGSCSWPVYGPDLVPVTGILPAKERYDSKSTCTGGGATPPSAPTNLRIIP